MTKSPRQKYPFEASVDVIQRNIELFVEATFNSLSSFYLELPRGEHFIESDRFERAYICLKEASDSFSNLSFNSVRKAVKEDAMVLVVLRCIAGLSPPELADFATEHVGVTISQNFARLQDQKARDNINLFANSRSQTEERLNALIEAACKLITGGPTSSSPHIIHRLDKVDTHDGLKSVRMSAIDGVPYASLLYERLLGRPFASHRDSVSEKVGDIVEDAIQEELERARVPYHQTGRAERVPGFDQAPDFLIPDAENPRIVIEAKLTQDDGTARDKVTRVQHLDHLSDGGKKFEVVACIDGRGFRIRREDMRKLLLATRGKVFTMATMSHLVDRTALKEFTGRS